MNGMGTGKRPPDFQQFLKALGRGGRPDYLPFYEHVAADGFIAAGLGITVAQLTSDPIRYWEYYVRFWRDMGFDCVPMEIPLHCPLAGNHSFFGGHSESSEAQVVIRGREDYEKYPWPDEQAPLDFRPFEIVAGLLPPGMKIVGGVCAGPYEWAALMLGAVGLAYLLADDQELVGWVFERLGRLHVSAVRQLAGMAACGAIRQGDDLGFKTSTFLSPAHLRQYLFPIYTRMAAAAHQAGKPFIFHSCGNLAAVYDDLIDVCRIDGKHSFEENIMPVAEFKRKYGQRVTPVGGLDVDRVCRLPESALRAYVRQTMEVCFADGHWLLGTGNSLPDYMPVSQYRIVLDEARRGR